MILEARAIVLGYPFVARRYGRVEVCNALAVEACCAHAQRLANDDPKTEPAAVFFAFASRRAAFPFAWKLMSGFLAVRQAQAGGLALRATPDELATLCLRVLRKSASWTDVRAWFAPRLSVGAAP